MYKKFFEDIERGSKNGVIKKKIISHYITNGDSTIADISKVFDLSVPTMTKLIVELCEDGFVVDYGKIETTGGRRPNIYGLNPASGYFIGVDMKNTSVNIGLINFKGEIIKMEMNIPVLIKSTMESLDELCSIILDFISRSSVEKDKILNIQINISGRVNPKTGYSYSIFYFDERPLTEVMSGKLGCSVSIDNDTRAMTYGEYMVGNYNDNKDVLFVNISWGLAVGIIIDGKLYYGKSGFSGEYGHASVFDNEILCHCGKKGCLETEASGLAMHRVFVERCLNGESSILSEDIKANKNITLENIIDAIKKEDMLAIEIVEEIGNKLGKNISALLNLFNPDMVILGGVLSMAEDYILLPFYSAIKKYSLNLVNKDSTIILSKLKEKSGVTGACLLSQHNFLKNI
ncbi:ROK family transcriptional regulator [Prevotella sp. 10(H)]|uniref:ROK family transcriptional regulator n=1 Tax=Prevotella sp. 10(H) TaxID=1158294 RepID=UPI0004A73BDE|nr:ROK family transcriptional regulator [Prevotella sp. 10(H)]